MKNAIKLVVAVFALSMPFAAHAVEDPARQKEQFEQNKAERVKHMKARLDMLNQELSCVQEAASHEAMKACDEKHKAAHGQMEDQHRKERMQKMQEQESRRRAEFDKRMQEMQSGPAKK